MVIRAVKISHQAYIRTDCFAQRADIGDVSLRPKAGLELHTRKALGNIPLCLANSVLRIDTVFPAIKAGCISANPVTEVAADNLADRLAQMSTNAVPNRDVYAAERINRCALLAEGAGAVVTFLPEHFHVVDVAPQKDRLVTVFDKRSRNLRRLLAMAHALAKAAFAVLRDNLDDNGASAGHPALRKTELIVFSAKRRLDDMNNDVLNLHEHSSPPCKYITLLTYRISDKL